MKFTKAQINKERREKRWHLILIDDLQVVPGPVVGLEKRIKQAAKEHWRWKSQKWGDGAKFKFSEMIIEEDIEYPDMYSDYSVKIYKVVVNKLLPENDVDVIARLTKNAKAKARRANAKGIQEKKERTMLKKLKEKYKEKV